MTHKQIRKRMIKNRSEAIRRNFIIALFWNIVIVLIILVITLFANFIDAINNNKHESVDEPEETASIVETIVPTTTCEPESTESIETTDEPDEFDEPEETGVPFAYSKSWDSNTGYLLAKMAMAEAEGCPTETKEFVILTILNRVWSNNFPNTVEGVIFQKVNGVAQFTPTVNGRWERVEPNANCWTALHNVEEAIYDKSQGCTFFESCANPDNWHSRNLVFLFESGGVRFYKDK